MAKLYGEIAAKALLTLDKSFARANGQPLDASEVYYSLQAAKDYAATAQAYIGQKIVVIENGIVTHYSVEDTAGNLKELGAKPVADGTTIAIGTDGKITLANIAEANKTGTYNAVLVNGVLTWVKPSETTVEGLSDLISALTGRVDTAEADIDALQASLGVAAKAAEGEEGSENYKPAVEATGLHKIVDEEIARAKAAEKALDDAIKAIDYVDADELATELQPYAKSADVVAKSDYATDKKALEDSIATKVNSSDYATDKKALQDEDAAIREIAENVRDAFNTFMNSEDIDETVNTLKEVQAEIAKMTDATELATALASKADKSYVDDELAKKQDVIAEGTYATPGDVATAKGEAISDAEGKIATAKQEAIDAAASAAAGIYATQTALSGLETAIDGRLDVLEAINHDLYATKEELTAHDNAAKAAYATKDELKATDDVAKDAQSRVGIVEGKIDEITSVGGEPNVVEKIKVNGVTLEVEKDAEGKSTKSVNISVPTKFTDITDDSGFDARITEALNAANAAQQTANTAKDNAAIAQGEVDALEGTVGTLSTTVANQGTTLEGHTTKITNLETFQSEHTALYNSLKDTVTGHGTALASKAEQSDLNATNAKAVANETAIKTLNETTIPGINGEIAKKANSADVYTKDEVNAITGAPAEGKTLVQMIADAQSAATYDDEEVRNLISGNTSAIEAIYKVDGETKSGVLATEIARIEGLVSAEQSRAEGVEAGHETRIAKMETFWAAADDPNETIDKLAEIVKYIEDDQTGALDLAADIQKNAEAIAAIYDVAEDGSKSGVLVTEIARVEKKADDNATAIAAINNETTGILATAKGYTDAQIAAIPAATADALGLVKFDNTSVKMNDNKQLYVAEVSTDKLVQGTETLVLNGGSAIA